MSPYVLKIGNVVFYNGLDASGAPRDLFTSNKPRKEYGFGTSLHQSTLHRDSLCDLSSDLWRIGDEEAVYGQFFVLQELKRD